MNEDVDSKAVRHYTGACHCGAVRFAFRHEPITTALTCNCSICTRKNAVMSSDYIATEAFDLISGQEDLLVYHWGDRDVNHWFCGTCGVYPFHDSIYEPGKYRVNLGCVDEINIRELEIGEFDGKNLL